MQTTRSKQSHHKNFAVEIEESLAHRLKNHPFIVPVTTFLLLFFFSIVAFISLSGSTVGASDSRVVKITIDGKQRVLPTRAATVGDLLQRLDVQMNEADLVEPAQDTPILEDNFTINVYRARPVTIIDNGRKKTILSAQTTAPAITSEAGVTLHPEDKVVSGPATEPGSTGLIGEQVVITRAIPANINLYGTPISVRTHAKTVGEVLKEKNIQTQEGDTIRPGLDEAIASDTQIIIVRVGKQIATVEEAIPMPTETVNDASLPIGSTTVKQAGTPGKKIVTYEIELQNGKEVSRKPLQTVTVSEPVKQIVAKGTKLNISGDKLEWLRSSIIPPEDYVYVEYIMQKESTWRPYATNHIGCVGLGQSCGNPPPLITVCPSWQNDPVCQLNFFHNYAVRRYGSWQKAYDFWLSRRWW